MSKFSKILTVFLLACLLFGATAAFLVSAESEEKDPFNVTDNAGNDYYAKVSFHNDSRGKSQYYYYKNANASVTYDENYDFRALSGVTVDFDIDTSNFTEPNAKGVALRSRTAIVNVGETGFLSGGNKFKELASLTVKLIDGVPHLTNDTTNVPLPKGAPAHITNVIYAENKADAENTVTVYQKYFVNGEPCFSLEQQISGIKYVRFAALYVGAFTEDKTITGTNCLVLNNIAVNHYAANDDTLDPYKVKGVPTAPIYEAEKVVYNANYTAPGVGYVSVDEKTVCVPAFIPELLSTVKNGSVVEATVDVTDFDVPDGVDNFTLIYNPENTEFTLSKEDAKKLYIFKNDDDSYTVRMPADSDTIQLKLVVKYGDTLLPVYSNVFVFLQDPKLNSSFTVFDLKTLTLYENVEAGREWMMDIDGDVPEAINLYKPEKLASLTGLEAALIREEFDGILYAYADAEEETVDPQSFADCKYIAGYQNNGVFTPIEDSDGGYENYFDETTFESESDNWDWTADGFVCYKIENGVAVPLKAPSAETGAAWTLSSLNIPDTTGGTAASVTDLVKNTAKGNGTVDNYGLLIIR